jgi:hypothetical protein
MAGVGPAPKDASRRARRNAQPVALKVVEAVPISQPELPEFDIQVTVDGEVEWQRFEWPARTREWWKMWAESPLSADFTQTDWDFLMDTALIHARYWNGDLKQAAELRLRVAKFGATPEDRARLRISFAAADDAEDSRTQKVSSRDRARGHKLREA